MPRTGGPRFASPDMPLSLVAGYHLDTTMELDDGFESSDDSFGLNHRSSQSLPPSDGGSSSEEKETVDDFDEDGALPPQTQQDRARLRGQLKG